MAQGDFTLFEELGNALDEIDWDADTFKLGLTSSTPTAADLTPVWSDYTEVTPATGNYSAGGSAIGTTTFTEAGGDTTFNGDNVTWAADGSNPTNALFGIVYDSTTATKHAIGFVDLGGTFDMTTGPLTVTWSSNSILKFETQASAAYAA